MIVVQTFKITFIRVFIIVLGSLIPPAGLFSQTYSLEEVKENLYRERPQTGDLEIRKQSQMVIDGIASYRWFDHVEIRKYWLATLNKAVLEIQNEVVTEGATIWLIYNHGFVVKTPTICFGFDLYDYFETGEFLQLGDLLDVLFISHIHPDHWSMKLVDKMRKLGKPVVGPSAMSSSILSIRMKPGDTATISGLNVRSYYGLHTVPVSMFEVRTPEGISFLHTGDNAVYETLPLNADIDVLMINAWINWNGVILEPNVLKYALYRVNPRVALPAHINDLGHVNNGQTVPHWEPAYALYDDAYRSYDYAVLSWGERYHFDRESNDTLPANDLENPGYFIGDDSISVTWEPPLESAEGDTACFYRIIINKKFERFLSGREFSLPWDSIGSSFDITIYAYDDCGNQSNPAGMKVIVPDTAYPPRITGSSPGNSEPIEVFAGVARTFGIHASDPNRDTLTCTWSIDHTVLPEETGSEYIYNIPGLQAGVHTLTAAVSDQEFYTHHTWLLNHHNLMAIVDNDNTLMYSESRHWYTSLYHPGYYNGYGRVSLITWVGEWAEYSYFPEVPGNYSVYASAPLNMHERSLPVYCIIINDQVVDTIIQDRNPGDANWIELGTYYFPSSAAVVIRALNTGYAYEGSTVFTDAIKFVHETISSRGLQRTFPKTQFKYFPNPVNSLLTMETGHQGQYFVEIISLRGQLLYSGNMEGPVRQIDFSSFPKGVYLIIVRSGDQVWTHKIIKL